MMVLGCKLITKRQPVTKLSRRARGVERTQAKTVSLNSGMFGELDGLRNEDSAGRTNIVARRLCCPVAELDL